MMYLFLFGIAGIAVLVMTVILVRWLRRRRKSAAANKLANEREAEIRVWAEEVLALGHDMSALVETQPMPYITNYYDWLVPGYRWELNKEVQKLVRAATGHRNAAFEARDGVSEVQRRLGNPSRIDGLYGALYYVHERSAPVRMHIEQTLNVSLEDMRQELQGLLVGQIHEWANSARGGDSEAFDKLMQFLDKLYSSSRSARDYKKLGMNFKYPADWNELVARFYESPSVHHFIDLEPNQPSGYWRLQAAEVLRSRGSLTDALMVLAVANERTHHGYVWRDEIGDRLLSDLAKFVKRQRVVHSIRNHIY